MRGLASSMFHWAAGGCCIVRRSESELRHDCKERIEICRRSIGEARIGSFVFAHGAADHRACLAARLRAGRAVASPLARALQCQLQCPPAYRPQLSKSRTMTAI